MDDFVTYEPLPSAVVRGTISQAVASLQNRDSMEEVGHQIWVSGAVTFTLSPYYGRRPPLDVHEALLLISTFKAILTRFGYYASDFDINRKGTGSVGWGTLTRRLSSNLSDSTIGNIRCVAIMLLVSCHKGFPEVDIAILSALRHKSRTTLHDTSLYRAPNWPSATTKISARCVHL